MLDAGTVRRSEPSGDGHQCRHRAVRTLNTSADDAQTRLGLGGINATTILEDNVNASRRVDNGTAVLVHLGGMRPNTREDARSYEHAASQRRTAQLGRSDELFDGAVNRQLAVVAEGQVRNVSEPSARYSTVVVRMDVMSSTTVEEPFRHGRQGLGRKSKKPAHMRLSTQESARVFKEPVGYRAGVGGSVRSTG